ncbi:unnamed protein product [Peronospora belbahrii]|uniref:Fe2OG dioxygenase domain-containing protein n=1 Tax=Peronospora belbahrii TaxID=622444 RepID=A0ABN8CLC2_9STRA|nr:unnamed protein product [Peronospora belbahrii]
MGRKNAKKTETSIPSASQKEIVHTKKEKIDKIKDKKNASLTTGIYGWTLKLLVVVVAIAVAYYLHELDKLDSKNMDNSQYIHQKDVVEHLRMNVTCASTENARNFVTGCHKKKGEICGRAVIDNFVTPSQVMRLREIAEIGMKNRSALGGPTIMDINTGYVRDSEGLINIYQPEKRIPNEMKPGVKRFEKLQYNLYRRVVEKVRWAVMKEFGLKALYFSAPTFITRFVGNDSWAPNQLHDEYWHPHVDKENTKHYDYSSLLYLADYDEEFTGGLFSFIDESTETVIEPARGRLVMFTAGSENLHVVRKVETGTRYALSLWFSCDERKQFHNFLKGAMHKRFRLLSIAFGCVSIAENGIQELKALCK